jgi:hypothetical protein
MKWYWKVLIALILLIFTALFSANYIVADLIDKKVKTIQSELNGHYNFEYTKLRVNLIEKKIILRGFKFETVLDSINNNIKLDYSLKKLVVSFKSYTEVLIEGKLEVNEIILNQPSISYGFRKKLDKENVDENAFETQPIDTVKTNKESVVDILLKKIIIDKVKLIKGKVDIYNLDDPEKDLLRIEQMYLLVDNLKIDLLAENLDAILKSDEYDFVLQKVSTAELKNHDLTIAKIEFKRSSQLLSISDFHIKNKLGPKENASKQRYRSPWIDISASSVDIKLNPWHLYKKGVVYFKKIELDGVVATLYNDITLELSPGHKAMPPRAIREIDIPFKIDSINIINSKLIYQHKGKAEKPGVFKLSSLNVKCSNITNIDYVIENNRNMIIQVEALLWDEGKLTTTLTLDLKNANDIVYAVGTLKDMSIKKAETMIKPLYNVEISSGFLKRLHYDFTMNENIGRGTLNFDYKDLIVDIKKSLDEKSHKYEKSSKFFNFIANEAVISNNMPSQNNYIPSGLMIFDRTKIKPIFDLYWHSIQVGIMDIVVSDVFYKAEENYYKKERKLEKQEMRNAKGDKLSKKEKRKARRKKNKSKKKD